MNLCRHLKVFTSLDMMDVATASLKLSAALVKILTKEDWEEILNAKDVARIREILKNSL